MSSMKSLSNTFMIAIATLAVVSCVPTATEKKAFCGTNQAFDSVTRSCYSIEEVKRVPVGTATSAVTTEETPVDVVLTYTDANLDKALTCTVSSVSANVEVLTPGLVDGSIVEKANEVYQAAVNLAAALPAGIYTAPAATTSAAMSTSYSKARDSFLFATIQSHLTTFQSLASTMLTYATFYPSDITVQYFANLTQQRLSILSTMTTLMSSRCACVAGICTTTVIPKLNKSGTAGFSYTLTDKDGTSAVKSVVVSISAMSLSTAHLKPVAQSSYATFVEAADSSIVPMSFTISGASDLSGSAANMRYYFNGSKNGSNQGVRPLGKVTDCMDLLGSSGLTDTSCTYTPDSGDTNDVLNIATKASASIGDLVYTAKSEGAAGNNITIQYFSLLSDNSLIDPYITQKEKFGLVSSSGELFLRVVGNAIKVFINPGVTKSSDIGTLINNHVQAKRLVDVTPGSTALPAATPAAVPLLGGTEAFDTVPYYAYNLTTSSSNTANVSLSVAVTNDAPMVPKTYNSLFSQTEAYLEAETKILNFTFKDVDSSSGFTFEALVDSTPTCSTVSYAVGYGLLTASSNFTVGAIPVPTCAAGTCTVAISVAAVGDFSGNACLYYRVTDGFSNSEVQTVNLVVTNINDIPQLSDNPLPTLNPLTAAATNEDLVLALPSYKDIYVGPGGDVYEAAQLLTVKATSSNTTLVPNTACTNYTTVTSSPVGSIIPAAVGLKYFDTTNFRCYISTGSTLNSQWALYPSLTVFPTCAFDYSGNGSPVGVVSPSAANKLYLDKTNNKCFKSASTSSASWAQDASVTNYKIAYVPTADQSGTTTIGVSVTDNGGTLNSAVDNVSDSFLLTVNFFDDAPVFLSTITSIQTNEGGAVQSGAFSVDEDAGSTAEENAQGITITSLTTDNASVLPTSAITIFYDLNDNGVQDTSEGRLVGAMLESAIGLDAKLHNFYLKLDPVDGVSGNANIALTIFDGSSSVVTNFSFIVHPIAALHGGWNNISSVGIKTDKLGAPVSTSEIQCNYNKLTDTKKCNNGTAACTGSTSPNSTVLPDASDVLYWDSSSLRCYRSTGVNAFSWVELNTSCPISRTAIHCSDNNCIRATSPVGVTAPDFVGQYLFNTASNTCYVSTGTANTDWITYVPSKVTLDWKPFIMVGSDPDSGVQIAGWNVYRREAGADYDFKGGHLKNASSTTTFTITTPTVRTFTDTTAIAGKVYYYVVRPVDTIRNFPTYTPETFSEVRVLASPSNYSFVHRWIVNQEICNGMNITNTTTPYSIDQTNNFRCPYIGPGDNAGYYDYGKDLLVDTQEVGCPYGVAPKCTANGCVGIGAPVLTSPFVDNVVADDLYYDRGAGTCYRYSTGPSAWTAMESATVSGALANLLRSALNAPLVNLTEAKAATICSVRPVPTGTELTFTATNANLPSKKDFMAYASQKINVTDPEITEMEKGFSLNIQSRCNGSSASGLETAFTDSNIPSTSFIYSLPGTYSSGIRSLYTGSIPWSSNKGTEACVSRFGIQDLYGNVAEWTTDKMDCTTGYGCISTGASSYGAYDFDPTAGTNTYGFDLKTGPYIDANNSGDTLGVDAYLTNWVFEEEMFTAAKFSFPTALPISDNIVSLSPIGYSTSPALPWILDIGPSNGITTNKLHSDGIVVNGAAVNADTTSKIGTFAVGGSYLSGNLAGRYSSELVPYSVKRPDLGLRCIVPIAPSDYTADPNHSYPY